MPYIPHTKDDVKKMLKSINASSIDDVFDEIPRDLKCGELKAIPDGINEMEMLNLAQELALQNDVGICFTGAGSYDHHIPAAVWDITSRGEFLTAYTPYQAEASQGTLQLLYEYQTLIAELTGLDVANASLYDGATALAEAVLMAVRANKKSKSNRILIAGTIHPLYRETLETIVRNQHIEIISLPFNDKTGTIDVNILDNYSGEDITAIAISQPNFFGALEDVDKIADWAQDNGVLSIASVNPVSLGLLKPPGQWGTNGVDIACGEGQPFGAPMASGGPYFGFLSTKMAYVRQLPGRLIGRTHDQDGKEGFALTLQAREQHIRRGKATSNICTNQGLLVTAATIHMCLLGPEGLEKVAKASHVNTQKLVDRLTKIEGVKLVFNSPFFHEALLQLEKPVAHVIEKLHEKGIQGGYDASQNYPNLHNCLLVSATEKRTNAEIDKYTQELKKIME